MASKPYIWTDGDDLPSLELHSRTKHELLQSYLERYVETLTLNPKQERLRLTLIDGFAGGGEYHDIQSNQTCFGSPILMIQAMQTAEIKAKAARSKKSFELDVQYIFVEKDADTVRYLKEVIDKQHYPQSLRERISVRLGSFEENLPSILAAVKAHSAKASRAIFVLDQYGYKDAPFALIRQIFGELQKPEVLLTFGTDCLLNYLSDTEVSKKVLANLGLHGDYSSVEKFKSEFGDDWRRVIQIGLHTDIRESSGADFYTPFFIRSAKANRDYWLVHLSKHARARDVMMGLHWEKQNQFQFEHDGRPGLKMLGYNPDRDFESQGYSKSLFGFDNDAHDRMMQALRQELPERIGLADTGALVRDLLVAITNESPATHADLKSALRILSSDDEIIVKDAFGKVRQRGVRLSSDDRVLIPRNKYRSFNF